MARQIIKTMYEDSEGKEYNFHFNTMHATKAFLIKAQLVKHIIPSVAAVGNNFGAIMKAIKAAKSTGDDNAYDKINIDFTGIVEKLLENMSPQQFLDLIKDLINNVKVFLPDTKASLDLSSKDSFDEVFNSEFGMLYKLVGKVLEANFGSLFGKSGTGVLSGFIKTAQEKMNQ